MEHRARGVGGERARQALVGPQPARAALAQQVLGAVAAGHVLHRERALGARVRYEARHAAQALALAQHARLPAQDRVPRVGEHVALLDLERDAAAPLAAQVAREVELAEGAAADAPAHLPAVRDDVVARERHRRPSPGLVATACAVVRSPPARAGERTTTPHKQKANGGTNVVFERKFEIRNI